MSDSSDRFDARDLFRALAAHGVEYVTVGGIAHRDDLLEMKRAAGRPQDLADARLLESLDDEA